MTALLPGVQRLRAANPSPLTGTGTNTYVVGTDQLAVIDPGPDLPDHLAAILQAAGRRPVVQIIVTHAHRDHSALAPRLAAATGAEILAFGTARDGTSPQLAALDLASSGEGLDTDFRPDRRLGDGDSTGLPGHVLRVLHTPGHLGGHLCLALGEVLFSGDHVMGWSTSIVSPPEGDMGAYMASLRRLAAERWGLMLPGHGEAVADPAARLAELIAHRLRREAQILQALQSAPATPAELTARIYTDTPAALWPAAMRNVLAHLLDLAARNLVTPDPAPGLQARYRRH